MSQAERRWARKKEDQRVLGEHIPRNGFVITVCALFWWFCGCWIGAIHWRGFGRSIEELWRNSTMVVERKKKAEENAKIAVEQSTPFWLDSCACAMNHHFYHIVEQSAPFWSDSCACAKWITVLIRSAVLVQWILLADIHEQYTHTHLEFNETVHLIFNFAFLISAFILSTVVWVPSEF